MCRTGVVENVHHFLMECPKYSGKRDALLERAAVIYDRASNIRGPNSFKDMPSKEQARILLGKRFDNPRAEDVIDRMVKRFITKAWNMRQPVTAAINLTLDKQYEVFVPR